jgi:hypothetical protein
MKVNLWRPVIAMRKISGRGLVISLACAASCVGAWIFATVTGREPWFRLFIAIALTGGLVVATILHLREKISGEWTTGWRRKWAMKSNLCHPGIAMHRIHVGGLLFVIASTVIVLLGVPTMWPFFAVAIGGGLAVASVLRRLHG